MQAIKALAQDVRVAVSEANKKAAETN